MKLRVSFEIVSTIISAIFEIFSTFGTDLVSLFPYPISDQLSQKWTWKVLKSVWIASQEPTLIIHFYVYKYFTKNFSLSSKTCCNQQTIESLHNLQLHNHQGFTLWGFLSHFWPTLGEDLQGVNLGSISLVKVEINFQRRKVLQNMTQLHQIYDEITYSFPPRLSSSFPPLRYLILDSLFPYPMSDQWSQTWTWKVLNSL